MVNSAKPTVGLAAGRVMIGFAYRSTHPTAPQSSSRKIHGLAAWAKSPAAADDMGRWPRAPLPTASSRNGAGEAPQVARRRDALLGSRGPCHHLPLNPGSTPAALRVSAPKSVP